MRRRERADPVWREELPLVEQPREQRGDAGRVDDGEGQRLLLRGVGREQAGDLVRPVLREPAQRLVEVGQLLAHPVGAVGDQRADPELVELAVGIAQDVVEEPVLLVPERHAHRPEAVERAADGEEPLEERGRQVVEGVVVPSQLLGDPHEPEAHEGHPGGGVGLLEAPTCGDLSGPVEHPDVVHAEEPALEQVRPLGVLAVHPPGEAHQQLAQYPGEEVAVPRTIAQVDLPCRPRVYRRVHVGEGPLVRRQLPVGVLRPLPAEQEQLRLGECRVDVRESDRVEGQVPRREPGVLPLVRHRDHVGERDVPPGRVASQRFWRKPLGWWWR